MNKVLLLFVFIFSQQAFAKECPYPADPINWVMRYCAYKVETDDEVAIMQSACFKSAQKDMDDKKQKACDVKKNYKMKSCQEYIKLDPDKKFKTAEACLKDPSIKPFFAGE